jgi:hypothetical protein
MHAVPGRGYPEQRLDADDLALAAVLDMGDDREVDVAGGDALRQHRRRLADHGDLGARVGAGEARQDLRQVAVGIVVGHAEPDAALEVGVGEARDAFEVEPHDPAGIVEQPLAILGQLGMASVAPEERPPDPLLQPLHLHGDGRLRLEHDLGGARERAGIGDRDEGFELIGIEHMGHDGPRGVHQYPCCEAS